MPWDLGPPRVRTHLCLWLLDAAGTITITVRMTTLSITKHPHRPLSNLTTTKVAHPGSPKGIPHKTALNDHMGNKMLNWNSLYHWWFPRTTTRSMTVVTTRTRPHLGLYQ